jgi:hypothetical protein
MRGTTGPLCFSCDLGLERADEEPARVRIALELRAVLGAAGARGTRRRAIDAELRQRTAVENDAGPTGDLFSMR